MNASASGMVVEEMPGHETVLDTFQSGLVIYRVGQALHGARLLPMPPERWAISRPPA